MAPPLIALVFFIAVVAIVAIGGFIALRTGLWVRETSTRDGVDGDPPRGAQRTPQVTSEDADRFDRPEHVTREDPSKSRFIGT
jgi:hypothetical protein